MFNCLQLLRHLLITGIFPILLLIAGCVPSTPPIQQPEETQQKPPADVERNKIALSPAETNSMPGHNETCQQDPDPRKVEISERERDRCYHLQPGTTVSTKKKGHRTVHQTTSRCQPQSLIYARCRTGVSSCRLGDTSPVQWFNCAKRSGNTTHVPVAGSIMVLDGNHKRGMSTGHPVYVEQVKANGNGTWLLRISHTNYDRKCHLDLDAKVLFDPAHMTASFESGPWACWGNGLKVMGFILR